MPTPNRVNEKFLLFFPMESTVATEGELIGGAGVNICEQLDPRPGGVGYQHKKRASIARPLVYPLQAVESDPPHRSEELLVLNQRLGLLDHLRRNVGHAMRLRTVLGDNFEQCLLGLPSSHEVAVGSQVFTKQNLSHFKPPSFSQQTIS